MKLSLSSLKIATMTALAAAGCFGASAQSPGRGTKDFSTFQIINDRNIFNPNRRPRVQGESRRTIVDSFALTGTMSYSGGTLAVFDGTSSDYHKALSVGGKIAGYSITGIDHDLVKLSSGTNELELKVGMQMRRSDDGRWSASEASIAPAYASSSRSRSFSSFERRNESSYSRRNNSRTNSRYEGGSRNESYTPEPATSSAPPPDSGVIPSSPDGAPPPGMGNGDPNDPVVRLMMRRLQETGGGANPNDAGGAGGNQDAAPGNPPAEPGGPGQNSNSDSNSSPGNPNP